MADSVYKVVEVVGTSNESISKAIGRAISKAGSTLRHLGWFEVAQIRGIIENGQVRQHAKSPSKSDSRLKKTTDARLGAVYASLPAACLLARQSVPLVRQVRGFKGYYLVDGGRGCSSQSARLTARTTRLPPTKRRPIE